MSYIFGSNVDASSSSVSVYVDFSLNPYKDLGLFNITGSGFSDTLIGETAFGTINGTPNLIDEGLTEITYMQMGDINMDGFIDLVVYSEGEAFDSQFYWYLNNGNGGFEARSALDFGTDDNIEQRFVLYDFDGDSDLDIISGQYSTGNVVWFEYDSGTDTFASAEILTGTGTDSGTVGVAVADIDGDGDADIVSSDIDQNAGDSSLTFHLNNGGSFIDTVLEINGDVSLGIDDLTFADLNGDGLLDIIATSTIPSQGIAWYKNLGEGSFADAAVIDTGASYEHLVVDIDNDGDLDVLVYQGETEGLKLYENDGSINATRFTESQITSDIAVPLGAADFDLDGDIDILTSDTYAFDDPAASKYTVYVNDGLGNFDFDNAVASEGQSSFTKLSVNLAGSSNGAGFVDVNNDGLLDIIGGSGTGGELFWYAATANVTNAINNTIDGGDGDDLIDGGLGADHLIGNGGNDELTYRDPISIYDGGTGDDTLNASIDASGDTINVSGVDINLNQANYIGIEIVQGSVGSDQITGTAAAETLYGNQGADTLDAGIGNDQIYGGDGSDVIQDAAGVDILDGGDGNDRILMIEESVSSDTIIGGDGFDTADFSALTTTGVTFDLGLQSTNIPGMGNFATLSSSVGGDLLQITDEDGNQGIEKVIGGGAIDIFDGSSLADIFEGGGGNDTLRGDAGQDTLSGQAGNDSLEGEAGRDTLYGGDGVDTLYGGEDGDYIDSGAGLDTIFGGTGDDIIIYDSDQVVSNQIQSIDGGDGTDTVDARAETDNITLSLDHPFYTNVEVFIAGKGLDVITGGSDENTIFGFNNDDTIFGAGGIDKLYGDDGNDSLTGGADGDSLFGGAGNDTLVDDAGADYLDGGTGNDTVILSGDINTADVFIGGSGTDTLDFSTNFNNTNVVYNTSAGLDVDGFATLSFSGGDKIKEFEHVITGNGLDTLVGGSENNTFESGASNDILYGGLGDDYLDAGNGNDTLSGGTGIDTLFGGEGSDVIIYNPSDNPDGVVTTLNNFFGGAGTDDMIDARKSATLPPGNFAPIDANDTNGVSFALGAAVDDIEIIQGSELNDVIFANNNSIQLYGNSGSDVLIGGESADAIYGGDNDDVIAGGSGADSIVGGAGNDIFYDYSQSNSTPSGHAFAGDSAQDTFEGGTGNDILKADTFTLDTNTIADGINDIIDTFDGGDGSDTIDYSGQSTHKIIVDFTGTTINEGDEVADIKNDANTDDIADANRVYIVINDPNANVAGDETIDAIDQLTSVEGVVGGGLSDTLIGHDDANIINYLNGSAGNDFIYGMNGDDILIGELGIDSIYGGLGKDTLDGGSGLDVLYGGAGDDVILYHADNFINDFAVSMDGGADTDTLDASGQSNGVTIRFSDAATVADSEPVNHNTATNIEAVIGGSGDDIIEFSSGGSGTLSGGAGNDFILGNSGANTYIDGGEGDDTLAGEDGADTVYGGSGNDIIYDGNSVDIILGGETISAESVIEGAAAAIDVLHGDTGNDTFIMGDDVAYVSDTIDGGTRIASFTIDSDVMTIVDATSASHNGSALDTINLSTNLTIDLSQFGDDDSIIVDLDGHAITIDFDASGDVEGITGSLSPHVNAGTTYIGYAEDDHVDYSSAPGNIAVSLNDTTLDAAADTLATMTGAGADKLQDIEHITTGTGADSISGNASDNTITTNNGNDILSGKNGDDVLSGGNDNDTLGGGNGTDTLYGGDGADILTHKDLGGDLTVSTDDIDGDGNDTYYGGDGADTITAGNGENEIYGGAGVDAITSGSSADLIFGGESADNITSGGGNDQIYGGGSGIVNVINSGDGDDTIYLRTYDPGTGEVDDLNSDAVNGSGLNIIKNIDGGAQTSPVMKSGVDNFDEDGTTIFTGGDTLDLTGITSGNIAATLDSTVTNIELVILGDGSDSFMGNASNNIIVGDDHSIIFDEDATTKYKDDLYGDAGSDILYGALGDDELVGGADIDTVYGGAGNDKIDDADGGGSADSYFGGAGDDIFYMVNDTTHIDKLYGGDGLDDTADYSAFTTALTLDLSDTTVVVAGSGNDELYGVEHIIMGSGNDVVIGNDDDNTITGGVGSDRLEGGNGNDYLIVSDDDDTDQLIGGEGIDTADFSNEDRAITLDLTDAIFAGSGVVMMSDHNDSVTSIENFVGTNFADTMSSYTDANYFMGGSGADTLNDYGSLSLAGEESFYYDANDTSAIWRDGASDTFEGGAGNDVVNMGDSEIEHDWLYSKMDAEIGFALTGYIEAGLVAFDMDLFIESGLIEGTTNPWVIDGVSNSLYGGDGDDTFNMGRDTIDADTVDGGADVDTVNYDENALGINVTLDGATLVAVLNTGGDMLQNIENVIGSEYADTISVSNLDEKNVFYGLGGNDVLNLGLGNDTAYGGFGSDQITAGDGNDLIEGGAGDDVIIGGSDTVVGDDADLLYGADGNDSIYGGDGVDKVYGGSGIDALYGGSDADSIYGGDGTDYVYGGLGDDISLLGEAGNDYLYGDDGSDILYGGFGNDTLYGGAGVDTLFGGVGYDMIFGGAGDDSVIFSDALAFDDIPSFYPTTVTFNGASETHYASFFATSALYFGGEGIDTLYLDFDNTNKIFSFDYKYIDSIEKIVTGNGDDYLDGKGFGSSDGANEIFDAGGGSDTVYGDGGHDTAYGGTGNDFLYGQSGNDTLYGGDDADYLHGGTGANTLVGGAGNDILHFNATAGEVTQSQYIGVTSTTDMTTDDVNLVDMTDYTNTNVYFSYAGSSALSNKFYGIDVFDLRNGVGQTIFIDFDEIQSITNKDEALFFILDDEDILHLGTNAPTVVSLANSGLQQNMNLGDLVTDDFWLLNFDTYDTGSGLGYDVGYAKSSASVNVSGTIYYDI